MPELVSCTVVFRLAGTTSIATGAIRAVLVVFGFGLILLNLVQFAVLSEVVSLLAGAGTVGLRQAGRNTSKRRRELSDREAEE